MRSVKELSNTKEKLLEEAAGLMLSKGFPATTIDEICEKAGVTKGCFFHYFSDKAQLGRELVERSTKNHIENAPYRSEKDPLKRVYACIDDAIEKFREGEPRHSCILGTFAQELSDTYPEIRKACERSFSLWAELLSRDLEEAKAARKPAAQIDSKSTAYYFIALLEGSMILAKAQRSTAVPRQNLKLFREHVAGIFEA